MEKEKISISEEELKELSIEELVDLKLEVDNILNRIDELLKRCEETIIS